MSNFQDELTLFFGTPVVTGLVGYLVAHLTGIVKVLRGGNISVQQVKDLAEKVDPKLVASLEAKLSAAEKQVELRVNQVEAEVQARVATELEKLSAALAARVAAPAAPPVAEEPPAV